MSETIIKAPFPYFGGKSRVADIVWNELGDVKTYAEPFAGSMAVLFGRPKTHVGGIEVINDKDMYVANFWRAVKSSPEEVAFYADEPCNEADLTARHIWLVNTGYDRIQKILGDPEYYDAKVAGWWVWGISNWLGSQWCTGLGRWTSEDGKIKMIDRKQDKESRGVKSQRPHITTSSGINVKRIKNFEGGIYGYMEAIQERLKNVAVCCGDWSRIVTKGALSGGKPAGIFLDPPYTNEMRYDTLYCEDDGSITRDVEKWCIESQTNKNYKIVLAGYSGEYNLPGWKIIEWKSGRAYASSGSSNRNIENRDRERLWVSPSCL